MEQDVASKLKMPFLAIKHQDYGQGTHLSPLGVEQLAAVLQAQHFFQLTGLGALREGLYDGAAHFAAAPCRLCRLLQRPRVGIVLLLERCAPLSQTSQQDKALV